MPLPIEHACANKAATSLTFQGHMVCNVSGMHTADEWARTHDMAPSDAKLRAQIQEKLKEHGQVDATKIGIVVRDGQVLLWGSVASANERTVAGEIAAQAVGRTAVINHIHVFRSSQC
jgi:osmotically-inducible protein OsmY